MRTLLVVGAVLALASAAQAQSANRYLNAAMKLHGDLEYESALENLKKAEKQPGNTLSEDVQIGLFSGLIHFELGNVDAAESAFKAALALDEKLELPKGVSPKVQPVFEKARREIFKRKPPAAIVSQPPKQDPARVTVVPLAKPSPLPEPQVQAKSGSRTLGIAIGVPLLAIGAGILGGGSYFGLQSKSSADDARSNPYQCNDPACTTGAKVSLDNAKSQATSANIMFGVGAAVVVAGVVTLVATLATSSGSAPSTTGEEMPGTR